MKKYIKIIVLVIFCFNALNLFSQTLEINIKNIKQSNGQLCIAFFATEQDFKSEKVYHLINYDKSKIKGSELHLTIPFKKGTYGISVLDDKNNNLQMDYNYIGIPREGFGFSNYMQTGVHRPVFSDFVFRIEGEKTKVVNIEMKYF